ncbi:MAG: hypothetical protein WDW36_005287 [Sanguina aurantia]
MAEHSCLHSSRWLLIRSQTAVRRPWTEIRASRFFNSLRRVSAAALAEHMPPTTTPPCRNAAQGTAHATQHTTPALPESTQGATRGANQGTTEPPSVVQQLVVYGLGSPEESRVSRYQDSIGTLRAILSDCRQGNPRYGKLMWEEGPARTHRLMEQLLQDAVSAGALEIPCVKTASVQFFSLIKGDMLLRRLCACDECPVTAASEIEAMARAGVEHAMAQAKPFVTDIENIRTRARQDIEQGAVTAGYSGDRETIVKLLNHALATELVCVLRYKYHYYMASGINSQSVKSEFLEHANEEQGHADLIAERITQLDGKPNLSPEGLLSRSHASPSLRCSPRVNDSDVSRC